jgi:hypothetical protein
MKLLKNKINLLVLLVWSIGSINVNANDSVEDYRFKIQNEVDRGFKTEEVQDVVFIEKNQPAPYSGLLFPESKAREVRSDLLEKDKLELKLANEQSKSKSLYQIIELKNSEIELYNKQNTRLLKLEDNSEMMRYIWFGLGVLVTGAAVYGAGGLSR